MGKTSRRIPYSRKLPSHTVTKHDAARTRNNPLPGSGTPNSPGYYPPGYPDKNAYVLIRTFGVLLVGLMSVLISYLNYTAQKDENMRRENMARSQLSEQSESRKTERLRALLSLAQDLKCDAAEKTQIALLALKNDAPEQVQELTESLLNTCTELKPATISQLKVIQHQSAREALDQKFEDNLSDAWLCMAYGSYSAALKFFEAASNGITGFYVKKVDFSEVSIARTSAQNGKVKEAVDHYAQAFRSVSAH